MRFTIVTPSYNQLDWLRLCVASVRDQVATKAETGNLSLSEGQAEAPSEISIEHIVQDAGTPGIEEFARENQASFYRDGSKVLGLPSSVGSASKAGYSLTIYSEKDAGMYDAINKGLRKASGEICAYLNCDEQYLQGALSEVAHWFDANSRCDVAFGDIVVVKPDGKYLCDRTAMLPTKLHTLVSGNLSVYSAATFFRKSAVLDRSLLFSSDWKVVGDSVWISSLLDAGLNVGLLERRISSFIYSGDNLSLDVKGEQERAKLRATASPVARACAPAIVAFFRMRRLLAGGYSLPSQDYAIFTDKNGPRREVFEVKQPTHRWPRQ